VEVHNELFAVRQPGPVERIAAVLLFAHVHMQLAQRRVLLALDEGHVPLVQSDKRVLPCEQAQSRQLLSLAVRRGAEVASHVAVLLVREVDLAVVASIRLAVVELAGC
jgi:hypothetical protein